MGRCSSQSDGEGGAPDASTYDPSLQPIFLCVPSQNGFVLEAPHRQSQNGLPGGSITFPEWSLMTTSPVTFVDPFLLMTISTAATIASCAVSDQIPVTRNC